MVDMIPASARLLRYDGRLFPTKRVVAPDSNLFVPVLTLSVSMLLPPLQGTSTGAARSMPGLRAAERRVLLAPDAPAEFSLHLQERLQVLRHLRRLRVFAHLGRFAPGFSAS